MLRRTFLFGAVAAGAGAHVVHKSAITGPGLQSESLIFVPPGHNAKKKNARLLLWLHGASLRGSNVQRLRQYGPPRIAEMRGDFPFVLLSPQCPSDKLWTEDATSLMALVDEVIPAYGINPERVYLTGLSMGGSGAWFLGSQYPHRFGAVVPLCGPTQPLYWADGLRHMPIWCFHGDRDRVVPLRRSREMVQALKKIGNRPRFTILRGKGHNIESVYDNDDVYRWMLSKRAHSNEQ